MMTVNINSFEKTMVMLESGTATELETSQMLKKKEH